jgi:hypothetical protein
VLPRRLGGFALEALFLVALALGAGLAHLRPLYIVAVMAAAWLLVALAELTAARIERSPVSYLLPQAAADEDEDEEPQAVFGPRPEERTVVAPPERAPEPDQEPPRPVDEDVDVPALDEPPQPPPEPEPEPEPEPIAELEPAPEREPEPAPEPDREPEPERAPFALDRVAAWAEAPVEPLQAEEEPEPEPEPIAELEPEPEREPEPAPEPDREPEPERAPFALDRVAAWDEAPVEPLQAEEEPEAGPSRSRRLRLFRRREPEAEPAPVSPPRHVKLLPRRPAEEPSRASEEVAELFGSDDEPAKSEERRS